MQTDANIFRVLPYHLSALYLRENLVTGPAAKMRGSLVWWSVSITSRRSNTRQASFMAVESKQMHAHTTRQSLGAAATAVAHL